MLSDHLPQATVTFNGQPVAIHKEWVWDSLPPPYVEPQHKTMREVAAYVCKKHGVTLEELKCDRRTKRLAYPRQEFMALAMELKHTSSPMVGAFLGGRDHATVLWGVKAHWRRVECGLT